MNGDQIGFYDITTPVKTAMSSAMSITIQLPKPPIDPHLATILMTMSPLAGYPNDFTAAAFIYQIFPILYSLFSILYSRSICFDNNPWSKRQGHKGAYWGQLLATKGIL
ncbi:MAG: hypothetical protein LBJ67_08860 [Planctomycetaceae bacterium]|jgi:hypothetical protein|nr:hypothetical protein [Planctomycetaceae bacterium]